MVGFPSGKSANGTSPELLFAVRDLSFSLAPGEVLGLVGESGSGKSVTSLAIMRLLPQQAQVGGEILLSDGGVPRDLLQLPNEQMRTFTELFDVHIACCRPGGIVRKPCGRHLGLTADGSTRNPGRSLANAG